jgi:LmbE family N-acetylglucosaminyl deacetylase
MANVVLSFLAHPDDAEILCGGTLIRLASLGWQIHIATCTAGDCGSIDKGPREISAIRTGEARAAAATLGGSYHCLEERDALVVYDKPTLLKAYDLFRRVAPTLVLTHAPRDYMVDHEQASLIARAASFIYSAPNISTLPLLPGAGIPHLYYCDPLEGLDSLGNPVNPTTLLDISPVMEAKCRLLSCHASQRQWLQAHHGMDEYVESMKRHAQDRGMLAGTQYAEAFVQHRGHAYPRNDLLAALLAPGMRQPGAPS